MKDIVITSSRISREMKVFLVCFILAFLINAAAVIAYVRPWTELFSQLGFVVVISICLYFVAVFLRLIFGLLNSLFLNRK